MRCFVYKLQTTPKQTERMSSAHACLRRTRPGDIVKTAGGPWRHPPAAVLAQLAPTTSAVLEPSTEKENLVKFHKK